MVLEGRVNRLVFFGDSICVGQGVSIHKGWVTRIAAHVESLAQQLGVNLVVVNSSINGSTTRQALERMPYDVQSHGVSILLLQFGMNDCNYWQTDHGLPRVSPGAFAANLEEIINRGRNSGANRILVNTNHPTTRDQEPLPRVDITYEASNRHYNDLIREVAASAGCDVVLNDVERKFHAYTGGIRSSLESLLLSDGLHLSMKGHDLYYEAVLPHFLEAVGNLVQQD